MAQFPSTTSASDVWSLQDQYRAEAGNNWPGTYPPFTGLTAAGTTNGPTTGSFIPSTSGITIYGCAGGGNGGPSNNLGGGGGGGGAASQMSGYSLATTPGETLDYSVGGPGQNTTITRGGVIVFELNAGQSVALGVATGGTGGALNSYASHAGGPGANGGGRDVAGASATSAVGCRGGGGGGGYGDNSPARAGQPGGNGGTSSVVGALFAGTTGGAGGAVGSSGGNKLLAYGGTAVSPDFWSGGGAGAGAGIALLSLSPTTYYGGGGGGNGAAQPATSNKGGPGVLYIVPA